MVLQGRAWREERASSSRGIEQEGAGSPAVASNNPELGMLMARSCRRVAGNKNIRMQQEQWAETGSPESTHPPLELCGASAMSTIPRAFRNYTSSWTLARRRTDFAAQSWAGRRASPRQ